MTPPVLAICSSRRTLKLFSDFALYCRVGKRWVVQLIFKGSNTTRTNNGLWTCVSVGHSLVIEKKLNLSLQPLTNSLTKAACAWVCRDYVLVDVKVPIGIVQVVLNFKLFISNSFCWIANESGGIKH